ncbi:phosphate ABC transporter permease PstA [Candidatus Methylacidithermus pantelleriae]|uniref:Phosphate transport system permease protein PstA n=1 Tax=Candidatus Methylacidithermus pantelleriae TaxID=2744239 RepID=A0A8J2BQS0_9BACT|nr:phosphate ABC transporter permease PstA [Candidatus Methylacidithermus pantelleriae]CAF0702616.1 Phosphate ABC transporter, permease protein [Candidatus Methylacidithermus pantelleriae]
MAVLQESQGVDIQWKEDTHSRWRRYKSYWMAFLCAASAVAVVTPLALIFFFLVQAGWSSVNWEFFTHLPRPPGETGGGMANAIVGSAILLAVATLVGAPIGILGAVYLSEFGYEKIHPWVRFVADVLNGVPSIVWGMTFYALMVVPFKGFSGLSGAMALGAMMLPIVMRTTEEILRLIPQDYREAGIALGIPHWKVTVFIVLRTGIRGIVTGVLVGLARVAGETAPLLFTAFGNPYWSFRLDQPMAALPLQIFVYAISPYDDWHRQAWAGALVLLVLVLLTTTTVRFLGGRLARSG